MTAAAFATAIALPTVEQLVVALEQHLGKPRGGWTRHERDVAIYAVIEVGSHTPTAIAGALRCGRATVGRARGRIDDALAATYDWGGVIRERQPQLGDEGLTPDQTTRLMALAAEHHLDEAFVWFDPTEDRADTFVGEQVTAQ